MAVMAVSLPKAAKARTMGQQPLQQQQQQQQQQVFCFQWRSISAAPACRNRPRHRSGSHFPHTARSPLSLSLSNRKGDKENKEREREKRKQKKRRLLLFFLVLASVGMASAISSVSPPPHTPHWCPSPLKHPTFDEATASPVRMTACKNKGIGTSFCPHRTAQDVADAGAAQMLTENMIMWALIIS